MNSNTKDTKEIKVVRSTKKNTKINKYKRNGKYTTRGQRAKQSILEASIKRNEELMISGPRETVVEKVLNRDKMQSIALPPTLKKERFKVSKHPNKHNKD